LCITVQRRAIALTPLEADGRGGSWCRVLLVLFAVLYTKFFLCVCVLHVLFGVVYEVTLVKFFEWYHSTSLELACLTVGLMGLKHIHT
jgi:hypothetical protein